MIKTTEYFNMTVDELLVERGNGYTREECKILDDGIKITFFDSVEEYEKEKEEFQNWIKECDAKCADDYKLTLKVELLMINERVAVIYT